MAFYRLTFYDKEKHEHNYRVPDNGSTFVGRKEDLESFAGESNLDEGVRKLHFRDTTNSMSKMHGKFFMREGRLFYTDERSTNGTCTKKLGGWKKVDGEKELTSGYELWFGTGIEARVEKIED